MALCHRASLYKNIYTELRQGSKKAVVVVRNSMAYFTDPLEETPDGQGSGSATGAQTTYGGPVAGRGWRAPRSPYPQIDC